MAPDERQDELDRVIRELKELLHENFELGVSSPEELDENRALVEDGIGLDSVDVLDLTLLLQKDYGVKFRGTAEQNREHFESLRTLAEYVLSHREDS